MGATPEAIIQSSQDPTQVEDLSVVQRAVTYELRITTDPNGGLRMPYVLVVDGVVRDEPAPGVAPRRFSYNKPRTFMVPANSRVALHLNNTAPKQYRRNPVYAVTPSERDVHVTITEQTGKRTTSGDPVFVATRTEGERQVDHYSAELTGDIWMAISHRFTTADAANLLPATTDPGIHAAILAIYNGLTTNRVVAKGPIGANGPAWTVTLEFTGSPNATANITTFHVLADGVTRVHPWSYLALLEAARQTGVTSLTVTSPWRPLTGSIAHRCGLGLDITWISADAGPVHLNRAELRGGPDGSWVTDEEARLFHEWEAAAAGLAAASKTLAAARRSLRAASDDPQRVAAVATAQQQHDAAEARVAAADTAWNAERDAHEPAAVRSLRSALTADTHVRQIFDPWRMDSNTRDAVPAQPNYQVSGLERGHNNHLHITIRDPEILG